MKKSKQIIRDFLKYKKDVKNVNVDVIKDIEKELDELFDLTEKENLSILVFNCGFGEPWILRFLVTSANVTKYWLIDKVDYQFMLSDEAVKDGGEYEFRDELADFILKIKLRNNYDALEELQKEEGFTAQRCTVAPDRPPRGYCENSIGFI